MLLRSIFYLFTLIPFVVVAADRDTLVDIKKDFGALGDGLHNDHQSFIDASSFINERKGHVTLQIPAGTYIVGRQLEYNTLVPIAYRIFSDEAYANPYYKLGLPVIFISGCKNDTIQGNVSSKIKFQDDMLMGSFDAQGRPIPLTDKAGNAIVPQNNAKAFIGDAIYIENSKDIKISNLELDGNLENIRLGGNMSADGWQMGQSGIVLNEVTKLKLTDLNVHHFAVDGLQIRNSTDSRIEKITSHELALTNCSFEYNGRQGFSWTGGAGLSAKGCNFSHTGRAYNRSIKKELSTAPGAGVDIEPESDPNINIYRLVKDGQFTNCTFENNRGVGMVADLYDEKEFRVAQNVGFDSCTFWGISNWSIWVAHPGFRFYNCNIYGSPVHSFTGSASGMQTTFNSCSFEDKVYIGQNGKRFPAYGNYLVEIADGVSTTFDHCTFTSHGKMFYYLVSSRPDDDKAKFIVNDCSFINASGSEKPKNSIADGVRFTGNNRHIDRPSSK